MLKIRTTFRAVFITGRLLRQHRRHIGHRVHWARLSLLPTMSAVVNDTSASRHLSQYPSAVAALRG